MTAPSAAWPPGMETDNVWRWVMWALVIIVPGGMLFYLLGCLILRESPWAGLWKQQRPVMYDGKEPYDQWAQAMEYGRKRQAEEEKND